MTLVIEKLLRVILEKITKIVIPISYMQRTSYDSQNRIQYVGFAYAGTKTSENKWNIKKITYDGTSYRITEINFAGGSNEFVFNWDNRTSYSYS